MTLLKNHFADIEEKSERAENGVKTNYFILKEKDGTRIIADEETMEKADKMAEDIATILIKDMGTKKAEE